MCQTTLLKLRDLLTRLGVSGLGTWMKNAKLYRQQIKKWMIELCQKCRQYIYVYI